MLIEGTAPRRVAEASVEDLVARVERVVRCRTGGRIQNLRIDVQGDDVVLTGVAGTYYAKQVATHAALGELAEQTLTNDIDVV